MHRFTVTTRNQREIVDLSPLLREWLAASGHGGGWCQLFTPHTTVALTLASLEPGAAEDILAELTRLVPPRDFRHLPAEHVPAHIVSAVVGASLSVPLVDGVLALGEFQKVVLIELDGPRERTVLASVLG